MKYCLSQAFNPISFVRFNDNQTNQGLFLSLIWSTEFIYILLGLYIVYKMCQLCSKAFSYSNFHIHQAYKFYTLALISTIIIMVSRAVQLQFAFKVTEAREHPQSLTPFRKDPYYEGWVVFNEIIGIISVYTVNMMYTLSSLTWLMIANKCDFNSRYSTNNQRVQQQQTLIKIRNNQFYLKVRVVLLYIIIPITMLISVCGVLNFTPNWCLTSKWLLLFTNLGIYILFVYSVMNILLQRLRDKGTPLKIKIIWTYLILSITGRQIMSLILQISDFVTPFQNQYVPVSKQNNSYNLLVFFYSLLITTIPIFMLSYLADKQLEAQKSQLERSERIIYTSTII